MAFLYIMCFLAILASIYMLYLKYRVVLKGEKCIAEIVCIATQNCGFVIGGARVKKHAYIVEIGHKRYYTAHGCIFPSLGKKKVGKQMIVFRNEKYGREVFKYLDFRIEILSFILLLFSAFCLVNI